MRPRSCRRSRHASRTPPTTSAAIAVRSSSVACSVAAVSTTPRAPFPLPAAAVHPPNPPTGCAPFHRHGRSSAGVCQGPMRTCGRFGRPMDSTAEAGLVVSDLPAGSGATLKHPMPQEFGIKEVRPHAPHPHPCRPILTSIAAADARPLFHSLPPSSPFPSLSAPPGSDGDGVFLLPRPLPRRVRRCS